MKGTIPQVVEYGKKNPRCRLRLCVPRILKDIGSKVVSNKPSINIALEQSANRFKLYMGHCLRAKAQQDMITEVMNLMKKVGGGEEISTLTSR